MQDEDRQSRPKNKGRREPARMCVVCRGRFAKSFLTRHVFTPQGNMEVDLKKIIPGRGIYLCSNPLCEAKFVKYRPVVKRKGKEHA
jgi:predicted RNA-binding protein YlxR (DUF448 family)